MKFIKEYPESKGLRGPFAVYELSEDEIQFAGKRYLLNKRFSEWAIGCEDHIALLSKAKEKAGYFLGTAFCDTIAECDLQLKCDCLQGELQNLKYELVDIREVADDAVKKINSFFGLAEKGGR